MEEEREVGQAKRGTLLAYRSKRTAMGITACWDCLSSTLRNEGQETAPNGKEFWFHQTIKKEFATQCPSTALHERPEEVHSKVQQSWEAIT